VQHSATFGLGIAGMGGRSSNSCNSLKETLFNDFSVAGNAASYAMGLVVLGSADPTCAEEMLTYAKETHHLEEDHLQSSHGVSIHLLWLTRRSQLYHCITFG